MQNLKLSLALLAVAALTVEGRPQDTVVEDSVVEGRTQDAGGSDFPLIGPLDQVSETGRTLYDAARTTGRAIGDELRQMFSDFWTVGAQALLGMNSAVRESTIGALQGARDTFDATSDFVEDSVRAGGRMAADAITTGLNVSRDTIGATNQFVSGMSGTAIRGFSNAADATANFVEDTASSARGFTNAASSVARKVIVGGIENFTDQ